VSGRNTPPRLSTYARRYIEGALLDAVKKVARNGFVRVPRENAQSRWVTTEGYDESRAAQDSGGDDADPDVLQARKVAGLTATWDVKPFRLDARALKSRGLGHLLQDFGAPIVGAGKVSVGTERNGGSCPLGSLALLYWANETDQRAAKRIKQIGMRAFALEVVAKKRNRERNGYE
jgi:hypothetical protein